MFAGAAKALRVRDRWIGWGDNERLRNLAWVINNTRFLIFEWVRVKNLASHVLGYAGRQIQEDWEERWGYRPVLMESFVDPRRYHQISLKCPILLWNNRKFNSRFFSQSKPERSAGTIRH